MSRQWGQPVHWARPAWLLLGMGILAGGVLRFVRIGELALIGDESYYWLWSRNLDWAYFDHPAGVALMVRLSTALGGESEAGIRWLNALLGASCILLVYLLGAQMLSKRAGVFAALVVALAAPYLVTSRFVYTDALQLALMLLNLLLFWLLVEERPRLRLGMAVAFGLSLVLLFNTKYNAYLYALALILFVLLERRQLLREGRFWLGWGLGALGLLPVVMWNASHEWVSFRWQLAHLGFTLTGSTSLLGSAAHGLAYLSWPLVLLALVGLVGVAVERKRRSSERLLTLVALVLLLPVALSPANSPRNLSTGLVLLLLLTGERWPQALTTRRQRWTAGLLAAGVVLVALYGVGTVVNLVRSLAWPASSIVPAIQRDAAGWRELGLALAEYPEPVYALDYSIASQIHYYGEREALSAWGQYRLWGIPEFDDVTIASLDYLPEELVTNRLGQAFREVEGPRFFTFQEGSVAKEVRIWQAEGRLVDLQTFLQWFDFLNLLEAARESP